MPEAAQLEGEVRSWRSLTSQLGAWQELLRVVDERTGLTVIAADPWSGTTGLLEELRREARGPVLLVDARRCSDAAELGMAIADEAVRTFALDATESWMRPAAPDADSAYRVRRQLMADGLDVDQLRTGVGDPLSILHGGLDAAASLASTVAPVVVIDHLGQLLAGLRGVDARAILETLRAAWQARTGTCLILVDFAGGQIEAALGDREHPLFHAGRRLRIQRAQPSAFAESLIISKPVLRVEPTLLRESAALAAGIPALTWQIFDLAREIDAGDPATRAFGAWQRLRADRAPLIAREWDVLRAVHRSAQAVAAAVSVNLPPYAAVTSTKSARDALIQLRAVGQAWQPAPRSWALSSPLLAAWVAEHLPPRAQRP